MFAHKWGNIIASLSLCPDRKARVPQGAASKNRAVETAFRSYTAVVMRTGVFIEVKTPVLIQSCV